MAEHLGKESVYQVSESECVLIQVEELLKAEEKEVEIELQSEKSYGLTKADQTKRS